MDASTLLLLASLAALVLGLMRIRADARDRQALHADLPRRLAGPWPTAPIPSRGWQPMGLRASLFRAMNDLPPPKAYPLNRDDATFLVRLHRLPAEDALDAPPPPRGASGHARVAWTDAGDRLLEAARAAVADRPRAFRHAARLRLVLPSDEGAPAHLSLADGDGRILLSTDLPTGGPPQA